MASFSCNCPHCNRPIRPDIRQDESSNYRPWAACEECYKTFWIFYCCTVVAVWLPGEVTARCGSCKRVYSAPTGEPPKVKPLGLGWKVWNWLVTPPLG
jgi:hypothetical protein